MASELIIERTKSHKNKDKAYIMGYIYTLNRVSDDLSFWACEKRSTCKARIHTRNDIIVKYVLVSEIQQAHTHTPSQDRVQMLKDYRKMKDIPTNCEQSARGKYPRYRRNEFKYYKQAAAIGIRETNDS